jgi:hypothetical protein
VQVHQLLEQADDLLGGVGDREPAAAAFDPTELAGAASLVALLRGGPVAWARATYGTGTSMAERRRNLGGRNRRRICTASAPERSTSSRSSSCQAARMAR